MAALVNFLNFQIITFNSNLLQINLIIFNQLFSQEENKHTEGERKRWHNRAGRNNSYHRFTLSRLQIILPIPFQFKWLVGQEDCNHLVKIKGIDLHQEEEEKKKHSHFYRKFMDPIIQASVSAIPKLTVQLNTLRMIVS